MESSAYQTETCVLDYTPAAALTGGEVIQLADGRAAIALRDVAAAALGAVAVGGLLKITKKSGEVWLDGSRLWWDHSANAATCLPPLVAGDRDFFIGCAVGDIASTTTEGIVNLNVKPVYEIDLQRDAFDTVVVKTVVGSTTVEVPDVKMRGGAAYMLFGATAEAQKVDLLSKRSFALASNWIIEGVFYVADDGDATAIDFNIGAANATHASDADAITESVFLHLDGNTLDLFGESDDGTTEVAATDTTLNIALGTPVFFQMDGRNPAAVKIYVNGVRVLDGTTGTAQTLDISAATGPLKLLAHLEKSADDTVADYRVPELMVRTAQQ